MKTISKYLSKSRDCSQQRAAYQTMPIWSTADGAVPTEREANHPVRTCAAARKDTLCRKFVCGTRHSYRQCDN